MSKKFVLKCRFLWRILKEHGDIIRGYIFHALRPPKVHSDQFFFWVLETKGVAFIQNQTFLTNVNDFWYSGAVYLSPPSRHRILFQWGFICCVHVTFLLRVQSLAYVILLSLFCHISFLVFALCWECHKSTLAVTLGAEHEITFDHQGWIQMTIYGSN